ncbi:unnamed protein product [Rhizoctonia solani]|uniref:Transmembrane protein n=1 Tax=Rhizoctonia solani TaxID=456999 RepID=A0A8H3AJ78_9AGAM|nr:unnamed protein product [Rhizoctonia solani]
MVNWSDPEIIAKQAVAFSQLLLVLLGLYTWEIFNNLGFDYNIIVNWRDFKVLADGRLFCLSIFHMGRSHHVDRCEQLHTRARLSGILYDHSAVWQHRNRDCLGSSDAPRVSHWAILFLGVISVRSTWDPQTSVCVVTGTSTTLLRLIYGYTMAFDLVVLVVSTAGLLRSGGWQGSDLWKLLFRDGIVYFVVAFVGNGIAAVFTILHLNAAMDIMFTVPAAVFSTIVACRAVRRLSEWARQDVYIHSRSRSVQNSSGVANNKREAQRPAVQITMETYTAQREDSFYHVERPGARPARVDLEAPDHSDDEGMTHKSMSQKDLTSPL